MTSKTQSIPQQLSFVFPLPWDEFAVPDDLSDWKRHYPEIHGTIYFDHSKKGLNLSGKPSYHQAFRAEVIYNGKKYRKRSTCYADCVRFLIRLHIEHSSN